MRKNTEKGQLQNMIFSAERQFLFKDLISTCFDSLYLSAKTYNIRMWQLYCPYTVVGAFDDDSRNMCTPLSGYVTDSQIVPCQQPVS